MNRSRLAAVTLLLLGLRASTEAAEPDMLIWRGCGVSKEAFMDACAAAYQKETGVVIRLSGGGATLGIESVADGGADLGGTCRACLREINEDKLPVKLAVVAWDALVVITHPENPVSNITRDQLQKILQQKITNWKELGGKDEAIVVVARRGKHSGVDYSTRLQMLNDVNADYGPTVVRLNSTAPVEVLVERQPRAIAVTGVSSAQKRALKVLTIDGHKPDVRNISSGVYPYFRPLYVAYLPQSNAAAKRFVEWLLSDKGQQVIGTQGTVTLAQGAALTERYRHFENVGQIPNYQALLELARRGTKAD